MSAEISSDAINVEVGTNNEPTFTSKANKPRIVIAIPDNLKVARTSPQKVSMLSTTTPIKTKQTYDAGQEVKTKKKKNKQTQLVEETNKIADCTSAISRENTSVWPDQSASALPSLSKHLLERLKQQQQREQEKEIMDKNTHQKSKGSLVFPVNQECTALKLAPTGHFLIGGFSDGTVRFFDLTGYYPKERSNDAHSSKNDGEKSDQDYTLSDDNSDMEEHYDEDRVKEADSGEKEISLENHRRKRKSQYYCSRGNQQYGTVACQIHAKGVHTTLRMDLDISEDGLWCFAGVLRGSMELVAIHLGHLEQSYMMRKRANKKLVSLEESNDFDMLDFLTVYRYNDAKLRGFGACTRLKNLSRPKYLLFTGKSIKNIHIWTFEPPASVDAEPVFQQIYDTSTNGNTIKFLQFRRSHDGNLQGISKSDNQKLRVWDLRREENEEILNSGKARPSRPPFLDVPNTESALAVAGGFCFCGGSVFFNQMSLVSLNVDNLQSQYNHTELALPGATPQLSVTLQNYRRRQQRGDLKSIINVAGMVADAGHVVLELSDGSLVLYSQSSKVCGGLPQLRKLSLSESGSCHSDIASPFESMPCRQLSVGRIGSTGLAVLATAIYDPFAGKGHISLRCLDQVNVVASPRSGFWGFVDKPMFSLKHEDKPEVENQQHGQGDGQGESSFSKLSDRQLCSSGCLKSKNVNSSTVHADTKSSIIHPEFVQTERTPIGKSITPESNKSSVTNGSPKYPVTIQPCCLSQATDLNSKTNDIKERNHVTKENSIKKHISNISETIEGTTRLDSLGTGNICGKFVVDHGNCNWGALETTPHRNNSLSIQKNSTKNIIQSNIVTTGKHAQSRVASVLSSNPGKDKPFVTPKINTKTELSSDSQGPSTSSQDPVTLTPMRSIDLPSKNDKRSNVSISGELNLASKLFAGPESPIIANPVKGCDFSSPQEGQQELSCDRFDVASRLLSLKKASMVLFTERSKNGGDITAALQANCSLTNGDLNIDSTKEKLKAIETDVTLAKKPIGSEQKSNQPTIVMSLDKKDELETKPTIATREVPKTEKNDHLALAIADRDRFKHFTSQIKRAALTKSPPVPRKRSQEMKNESQDTVLLQRYTKLKINMNKKSIGSNVSVGTSYDRASKIGMIATVPLADDKDSQPAQPLKKVITADTEEDVDFLESTSVICVETATVPFPKPTTTMARTNTNVVIDDKEVRVLKCKKQMEEIRDLLNRFPSTNVCKRMKLDNYQLSSSVRERQQFSRKRLAAEHQAAHEMLCKRVLQAALSVMHSLTQTSMNASDLDQAKTQMKEIVSEYSEIIAEMIGRQQMEVAALAATHSLEKPGIAPNSINNVFFTFPTIFEYLPSLGDLQ